MLDEKIFGAISVLWCGFYLNRMALHKDVAEEWFCKLSHFRLDTLRGSSLFMTSKRSQQKIWKELYISLCVSDNGLASFNALVFQPFQS